MWRRAAFAAARAAVASARIALSASAAVASIAVATSASSFADGHTTSAAVSADASAVAAPVLESPCCSHTAPGATNQTQLPPPLPASDPRAARARALLPKLRAALSSDDQLLTTDVELEPYGRDWHSHHSGVPPDAVVFPSSTAEVSAIIAVCANAGVPVVARGAGTSLEGHTTTPYRGVCIDLSRMDSIVAVRPGDLDCTVQAGVRWQELNTSLAPHGLFFPMDPGPGATIGGMVGTGCSGTNASRYGAMKANVLSLTVVLADGTVLKTGSRARKSSAGYDLTSLFTGSEGTLGIVTEATLRLQHVPARTAVAVCAFPDIASATAAVLATAASGVQMGAVELLDAAMVDAVNAQAGFAYPRSPHLFFKFSGSPAKVADDAAAVEAVVAKHGGAGFQWAADAETQGKLWRARKEALWSAAAMHPGRKIITTDVCVPLSRLPDLMSAMETRAASSSLPVYAVGHVLDGNAHHFIAFDPENPKEVAEARALNAFLVTTAQAMEGTCTGEHGVGVGKTAYLAGEYGPSALGAMASIKAALDPHGILNPGKKLPKDAHPLQIGGHAAGTSGKPPHRGRDAAMMTLRH